MMTMIAIVSKSDIFSSLMHHNTSTQPNRSASMAVENHIN